VRRYAESNNLVIFVVLLEFKRVVALITVNNKQVVATNNPLLYMRVCHGKQRAGTPRLASEA
jgi:hypothetical protein